MVLQDKYRIILLSAYAIGLHSIDNMLPTPLPWLRLGISNIISLLTLLLYGFKPALTVTLIRIIVSSIISGTFLGPAFVLSFGAGLISVSSMGFFFNFLPNLFSPTGISIIGALFHNITQLILAYFIFIHNIEVLMLISPIIILLGTLTGTLNGIISNIIFLNLKKNLKRVKM